MASTIPKSQTAAWLEKPQPGAQFQIRNDIEVPVLGDGDVLVKLDCTGFCHSDVHSAYGDTPMSTDIAGHEGIGHVVKVGPNVPEEMMKTRVGIRLMLAIYVKSWQYSTCGTCEVCHVDPTACPNQVNSGRNTRGTFQQYIAAPAKHVTRIPEGIASEAAAPLLCAGLTLYSAIGKSRLRQGDWLVIPGAGGGLGHIGVQVAARHGYKVIAIDTGDSKRALCLKLGATVFLDYKKDIIEDEVKRMTNGFGAHATIVSAGSDAAYEQAFKLVRNRGTVVCVGLPRSGLPLPISPFLTVVKGLTIVGSSVGTNEEMQELLEMAVKGEVVPQVEVFDFDEINNVMERLAKSEIGGRVVLKIPE